MPRTYDDYEDAYREDILSDIGGFLANPLGTIAGGIGHMLGGGSPAPPPRAPLPQMPPPPPPAGVGTGTITTPQGQVTMRLPSDVVTTTDFQRLASDLQDSINRATARLNTIDRDSSSNSSQLAAAVAETGRALSVSRRGQSETITRLRRQISNSQTMNMMISLMLQRGLSDRITALEGDNAPSSGSDNSMLMIMPFMFMSQDGDSDGDSNNNMMMMMMVMLAATGSLGGSRGRN